MESNQMGQMEPFFNQFDSPIQVGLMGPGTNNPALHQLPLSSTTQQVPMSSIPPIATNNTAFHRSSIPDLQMPQLGMQSYGFAPPNVLLPTNESVDMDMNYNYAQNLSMSLKRKEPMDPNQNNIGQQKLSIPIKKMVQADHRPWLQQKNAQQMHLPPNSSQSQVQHFQRKTVQLQSIPPKFGPQKSAVPKSNNVQAQPSPKAQTELFATVRSKLRESLASALALVTQDPSKSTNADKNSEGGASTGQMQESSEIASGSPAADVDALAAGEVSADGNGSNNRGLQETSVNGNSVNSAQSPLSDVGFQSNMLLPDEDVPFSSNIFAKDELLQGNGLSWVLEPCIDLTEREVQAFENDQSNHLGEVKGAEEQFSQTPEMLATKIEAELFKLFCGVNKKYKERGRSLLFNLKDRSNPELRERVMAGEIPPEKLCTMTAEDLASKELSDWRIAKAEVFAQMVVLPDSDARPLVKKTHKGEFQVEVEQEDSVSVEVSVGANSFVRNRLKVAKKEASPPTEPQEKEKEKASGHKNKLEKNDILCTLTIPSTEGNDLMQGLMVDDDEMKDAEFLPPIVSLDEFMESLNSEPPFASLENDDGKVTARPVKDDSAAGSDSKSPDVTPKDGPHITSNKVDTSEADSKISAGKNVKPENTVVDKSERVWEGLLQLTTSAVASVIAIFKSGQKTSTKEWPALVEIKGRVRLSAFEKFLQELPMSRSRAVMLKKSREITMLQEIVVNIDFCCRIENGLANKIRSDFTVVDVESLKSSAEVAHVICKDGSEESDRANLSEVADSYVMDERVGFAELSPGFELYLCPSNDKMRQLLGKIISSDKKADFNRLDNDGLIGVFVWRKMISPNSTSHHKHSKKNHFSSTTTATTTTKRTQQEPKSNHYVTTTRPLGRPHAYNKPLAAVDDEDDDDDVPPGFGPGTARDDDDLPEFNFSGGSNRLASRLPNHTATGRVGRDPSPIQNRSQDQMRALVQKYGQTGVQVQQVQVQVQAKPWNDEDDDDIPEWQPQVKNLQQLPLLRPHVGNPSSQSLPSPLPALHPFVPPSSRGF